MISEVLETFNVWCKLEVVAHCSQDLSKGHDIYHKESLLNLTRSLLAVIRM